MRISMEPGIGGDLVYASTMKQWEPPYDDEIISVEDNKRIRKNIATKLSPWWAFWMADSHLKCKAGFCENFEWSEIVESLSRSIVEPVRDVCKGVV